MPLSSSVALDIGVSRLTKANVRAFANAAKREAAQKRGERTPSPEQLHLGDSDDTERFAKEHPLLCRNRATLSKENMTNYDLWKPAVVAEPDRTRQEEIWEGKPSLLGSPTGQDRGCSASVSAAEPLKSRHSAPGTTAYCVSSNQAASLGLGRIEQGICHC